MQKSKLLFGMSDTYGKNSLAQDECHDLAKLFLQKSHLFLLINKKN